MRARALALAVFVLAAGAVSRADDRPLERAELDKRVVKAVYETAVEGTEMWNKSANYEGCFRLYQGTLSAVIPLLDHRPKLAGMAKDKLDKAKSMKAIEGATLLREALDEIQHEIAPGSKVDPKVDPKPDPKPEPMKTLWDRLGGEAGVKKIVDDLLSVAIEDKDVNLLRGKKLDLQGVSRLKQMLVAFISEGTGGTIKYTGKDMKSAHAGMKITEKEFDALAAILLEVLKKNKVAQPDIDDLMKAVGVTRKDIVEGKGN